MLDSYENAAGLGAALLGVGYAVWQLGDYKVTSDGFSYFKNTLGMGNDKIKSQAREILQDTNDIIYKVFRLGRRAAAKKYA